MVRSELHDIADAQAARFKRYSALETADLSELLDRSTSATDVHDALLKERPLLDARRSLRLSGPDPSDLRDEACAVGLLDATAADLAYRRLYPGLDVGVYCASHAMGKPSVALDAALEGHFGVLRAEGTEAWASGWSAVIDRFRADVASLVGGDLVSGDVLWFANFSDAHASLLSGLRGRMVTEAGHFTSARYLHASWATRTGSTVVEVPVDALGCTPTDSLIGALTPDTTVVSLSHALWRTGYLHEIERIAQAMHQVCPEAALLLDAYQTLGTVIVDVARLPVLTAVTGGGLKQLHAGTGAGFAWVSRPLLDRLTPDRAGWWAHRDPLAFADAFEPGPGGARFRTGVPSLAPMVALSSELRVIASSAGGDLRAAILRARHHTLHQVRRAVVAAEAAGLEVSGPREPARRAAFFSIRVADGAATLAHLRAHGVIADFRADAPGAAGGLLRLSANAASFEYELSFAVATLARR
jgi:kynureninase